MAKNKRKIYITDYRITNDSYYRSTSHAGCNKSLVRQTPYYPFNVQAKHPTGNWIYKWSDVNGNFKELEIANVK